MRPGPATVTPGLRALPALPRTVSLRRAGPELGQSGGELLAGGATAAARWHRPSYSGWARFAAGTWGLGLGSPGSGGPGRGRFKLSLGLTRIQRKKSNWFSSSESCRISPSQPVARCRAPSPPAAAAESIHLQPGRPGLTISPVAFRRLAAAEAESCIFMMIP